MTGIIVFATGTADPEHGGSGLANLIRATHNGILDAEIVHVVSNYREGSVCRIAAESGIPFTHFRNDWGAVNYRSIFDESGADFTALSGWLLYVTGLEAETTFNIHPGPLPEFGGKGMHGINVHRSVLEAFRQGRRKTSAVSMHFVNPFGPFDSGTVFFEMEVPILEGDTPEDLQARVNRQEHFWQPRITEMVVKRKIRLENGALHVPYGYLFLPAPQA